MKQFKPVGGDGDTTNSEEVKEVESSRKEVKDLNVDQVLVVISAIIDKLGLTVEMDKLSNLLINDMKLDGNMLIAMERKVWVKK